MSASSDFTPEAYGQIREGAQRSAARIVPLVLEIVGARTVCDVGCGEGWFAREFANVGGHVLALDETFGAWRSESPLGPGWIGFDHVDLTSGDWPTEALLRVVALGMGPKAELAVCLEVAEHLPPEAADLLVRGLCALAPVVLFSAAIPGQGGLGHLNEQWPAYWADLFGRHGRVANDDLRGVLWDDADVESWYRQNLVLYATPDWMDERALPYGEPYAVVHPDLFAARVGERDAAWAKLRENGLEP